MTSPIQDKEPDVSLALVRAAASGDLDAVKSLLASGADVNSANESGQTPLILAAVMGHGEVVVQPDLSRRAIPGCGIALTSQPSNGPPGEASRMSRNF